jgi:hypothetical protein
MIGYREAPRRFSSQIAWRDTGNRRWPKLFHPALAASARNSAAENARFIESRASNLVIGSRSRVAVNA